MKRKPRILELAENVNILYKNINTRMKTQNSFKDQYNIDL
jgi:hypothetical protein